MGGLALVTVRGQREARSQLEHRFELRIALGASFARSYAVSVLTAERRRAEASLTGRRVSERQFRGVVDALGLQAAVLLDRDGRLLRVWPPKPSILGSQVGSRYAHLRSALRGTPTVSDVVKSASRGTPVIGFATPFETAQGRRVFSGAFGIGGTLLDTYLLNALPFSGAELSLIDHGGTLLLGAHREAADMTDLRAADPNLASAVDDRASGIYRRKGEARFFARHAIAGTPWSLVASVPEGQLLTPVSGLATLVPWLLFAGFGGAALTAALLIWRLAEHRARLALSNEQLVRSNDELRDLDRLKDEFVALVSHELRTPLTSIIGYVSALKRGRAGALAPEQDQLLTVVERNAKRLVDLVSDLLTAAKADAGKLQLEPELVALDALIKDAVNSARPHADDKGIELRMTPTAPTTVFADRMRLSQVLDNLISNGIKFTPAGGHVQIDLIANGPTASVTIKDNGIGIPEAEQDQLFRRFFRASTATSREIQGSGLGLSIVKTIIDLHGGTIGATSSEGAGTTFRVTIPLAPAEDLAA